MIQPQPVSTEYAVGVTDREVVLICHTPVGQFFYFMPPDQAKLVGNALTTAVPGLVTPPSAGPGLLLDATGSPAAPSSPTDQAQAKPHIPSPGIVVEDNVNI